MITDSLFDEPMDLKNQHKQQTTQQTRKHGILLDTQEAFHMTTRKEKPPKIIIICAENKGNAKSSCACAHIHIMEDLSLIQKNS